MKDVRTYLRCFLVSMLLCCVGVVNATYKLQKVTSVHAGGLYVFEQEGFVMSNQVVSGKLQTTTTYQTTGLSGDETYVWTLEGVSDKYYLKNMSLSSKQYLTNVKYSTNLAFDTKSNSKTYGVWQFSFQPDETALIQNTVNSASRYLGFVDGGTVYKAYSVIDMTYAHAITVYELIEEGGDEVSIDLTEMTYGEEVVNEHEAIYDLNGRRVQNPSKGLFLVNGRKVLFR